MRKFRKKNNALFITIKIGVIWYALVLASFNFLSNKTDAIFTDSAANLSSFKAGTWWDKSSLKFTDKFGYDCEEIFAFIENAGDGDMAIDSKFHVYYHPAKNPVNPQKIEGELIFSDGVIQRMNSKEKPQKLSFVPPMDGKYKFVAFQHPKKPGNNGGNLSVEGTPVTFSETIEVKGGCKMPKQLLKNGLDKEQIDNEVEESVEESKTNETNSAEDSLQNNKELEQENSKEMNKPVEIQDTDQVDQDNPQTESNSAEPERLEKNSDVVEVNEETKKSNG